MRLGIFAKTFPGTTPEAVIPAAAAAGYDTVQYNMACSGLPPMPDAVPELVAHAVRSAASQAGISVVALSGTYNMIHPDPAVRRRGHDQLDAVASAARLMGAPLVTLCTGTRDAEDQWRRHPDNDSSDAWRDLRESFDTAVAIADRHDIDLGIEPELANVVSSAARARRLIDEVGSRRLRIVLDPANLFEAESLDTQRRLVSEAIDLLADRIAMGHAKDRTSDGSFTTAGNGVLDYRHYFARLKAAGFDGPLVTHGLSYAEAPAVAAFLRRALADAGMEVRP